MMIKVKLPGLAHLTNGETELMLEASNILEILGEMKKKYTQFRDRMFNPKTGKLYPELVITVNGKPTYDYTKKLDNGDAVAMLPVFSGG